MRRRILRGALFLVPFLFLCAQLGRAQAVTGTILGTVADPSGARVPGASVKVTDVQTGISHTATTDAQGDYIFPALPLGQYTVEAQASGFRKSVREGVGLNVNQNARVDLTLQIGSVSQTVVVKQNAPLVDTHDVQSGGLVDRQRVQDLPLNGRNVYSLVTLLAGVRSVATNSQPSPNSGNNITVNGSRSTNAVFLLDGGYNVGIHRNEGFLAPNPDAVQEFRVLTSNYDAQYGRSAGGVVNVVVRSGTNQFHGGAYDYLRNNALDARSFFEPTVSGLKRNQFGAELGGPILHDKLFGFFSYQGDRIRSGNFVNSAHPPTAAERQGDFSALAPSDWPVDPTTGAVFPGGIIPSNRLDPVSQNILKLVALPNTADGRWQGFGSTPENDNQYVGKSDYQISSAHRASVTLFFARGNGLNPFGGVANIPDYSPESTGFRQNNIVATETWTIKPNLLNQFLFSHASDHYLISDLNTTTWTDFGSTFQEATQPPRIPQIFVSGSWQGGTYSDGDNGDSNFDWEDSLTWIHGSHTVKGGSSFMRLQHSEIRSWLGAGQVRVTGTFTGNAMADFLLGQAASFRVNNGTPITVRSKGWYSFIQDDWKVSRRLTLNLGLRYELNTPYASPHNYLGTFRFGSPLPQSTVVPQSPPGTLYNGDAGIPHGVVNTDYNNFAPRLGVVVDPFGNGKTAIRAGFGVFYYTVDANPYEAELFQPYIVDLTAFGTPSFVDPWGNFPGGDPFPVSSNVANRPIVLPETVGMMDPNFVTPYVEQYSFVIQHQLRPNLSVDVGYIANVSRHLVATRDANRPVYTPGSSTAGNVNSRRPLLPGTYAEIAHVLTGVNSSYNSLQATVTRRFSSGFTLLANYTYSKALDMGSADPSNGVTVQFQNSNNMREDWGVSGHDLRHMFNVSLLWQPPKIQHFGFVGKDVLSGWQVNTIGRITSGSPFTVTAGKDINLDGVNNDRANLVGNAVLSSGRSLDARLAEYFSTAAFVSPPTGTDGTAARDLLYGPGAVNWNVSFFKDIPIHESHKVQFRAEFFNFFNHANFGNPVSNLNNKSFGQIQGADAGRIIQFALRYSF